MRAVIGLGNPGAEYALSRHNIGFRVLAALNDRLLKPDYVSRRRFYRFSVHPLLNDEIALVRPTTYMNRSGFAVRAFLRLQKDLDLKDILVVCDDLSLPLGKIRLRPKGSSGGHKGLESIIQMIQTMDFPRLRLGIRPPDLEYIPGEEYADFVLSPFDVDEEPIVEEMVRTAASAALTWAANGIQRAMTLFNSASSS
jgi:PTH1 family peptidyl-tRNA hydrolase